ncbi:hypothetical protein COCCADRAFT_24651 [Bipolaris zeicola 26-R-13]|uniref:Pantoate--beta-alanine ligase n=1 Tax=Cochliobolus carbonum (strain 26-R-13) TaxID=930089 RepID=W6YV71_COCC2|nr:uncharacterized protein COCCADRAFT_24651 [Bipolaris zeicola 26-R-13]EUC35356.1 hypothetical protein COCCADRAFT_24651 [Bipolaris zeicola 26-R-13]
MSLLRLTSVPTARSCLLAKFPRPLQASRTNNSIRFFSGSPSLCNTSSSNPQPQIFRHVAPLRDYRRDLRLNQRTVGLVPTMGALHEGHLSLMRHAAAENTDVFVTIYVNPTQFGLNEDLDSYPKTWESDLRIIEQLNQQLASSGQGRVTAVFAPDTKTIYPTLPPDSSIPGVGTFIEMRPLGQILEGASRPVFFRGVATVCMKLFNICAPDRVYFGQKDVQQTRVIKRMITDFHLDMDLRIIPTSRESDGLALSSRNVYLGTRRRNVAIVLNQALRKAEIKYKNGMRLRNDVLWPAFDHTNMTLLEQEQLEPSQRVKFEVDYISLADPDTMEEIEQIDDSKGAILSGVVKMLPVEEPQPDKEDLGRLDAEGHQVPVRLLDNIILEPMR